MGVTRRDFVAGCGGAAVAGLTMSEAHAQSAPAGATPPMSSEELARKPQTAGAKGDQQRHYYFAAAKQDRPDVIDNRQGE